MENQFGIYDEFILRAPAAPFSASLCRYDRITDLFKSNPHFRIALLLSSSSLFFQAEKLSEGKNLNGKEERIKQSLYKYYLRMCFRATPFGLWAGFCHGTFHHQTEISFSDSEAFQSYSRPDMNLLHQVAREFGRKHMKDESVKYFPNNTLYCIGNEIRYISYDGKNDKRSYRITAIEKSEDVLSIINFCKQGACYQSINRFIHRSLGYKTGYDKFTDDLIELQIIKNNFEPVLSGPGYEYFIKKHTEVLPASQTSKAYKNLLESINDFDMACLREKEVKLKTLLNQTSIDFPKMKPGHLIQTDMLLKPVKCFINRRIKETIIESLKILIRLTAPSTNPTLDEFINEFEKRYEGAEQPLLQVLDSEYGIPYPRIQRTGDLTPLLDDLRFPERENEQIVIERLPYQKYLEDRVKEAKRNGESEIDICWNDVEAFSSDIIMPEQFSALIKILETSDEGLPEKILFEGTGGTGGINLFGRLAHTDKKIRKLAEKLAKNEASREPDKIFAEIIHLPEERTGNILSRPFLREYEIPYLAQSLKDQKYLINASDIMICIRNKNILLRSAKTGKTIIPRLSTAHNYHRNTLPVYRFLCDIQEDSRNTTPGFSWDYMEDIYDYLPAVKSGSVYFTTAKWFIRNESLNRLKHIKKIAENNTRKSKFDSWKKSLGIPDEVILCFHDNELPLNLSEIPDIEILMSSAHKSLKLILKENRHNHKKPLFRINEKPYNNEINIIFHKHHAE